MLNVDQSQRRDIDTTLDDRLTLAIDEENIADNPYIFEPTSFVGNNWFKQGSNIVKLNLVEQDSIVFVSAPLVKLLQKDITNVIVSFDYNISNVSVNYPILSNISLTCMEMTNYMLVENILTTQGHIDVDCSLFNFSSNVVNTTISEQGFKVGINFNGNKSNATIKLSNVQIQFKYQNKLATQEDSVVNRLEPHIDFYRDEYGDLILQIGGDASGKGIDHTGGDIDTYSKAEIDNKLATKVNVEIGKGLSSEDYTLTEKTKLGTVETNANYYVHPSSHQTGMITESSALTNLETSENATQHEINLAIDSKISVGGSVDWSDIQNKPSIPSSSSDLSDGSDLVKKSSTSGLLKNDGSVDTNSYLTSSSLSNYVQKSSTTGLLKNDGTVDTTQYLSSLPTHNHDDRYYTESEVDTALNGKQATLISGTNIKTINNTSLLGSGNISIQGGGTVTVDDSLSTTSTNPVQNKVITGALNGKANSSHTHTKSEITDFPSIPSKTSDLTNDSGFITSSSLPTKTSDLTNDGDGSNVFVKDNDSRLSDARTPLAHTHLSSDVTDLIDVIYPVGSIYMSVNSTSPQTLFGFGVWEKIEDKFLLGSGTIYENGSTGGSADAVIVSHSHKPNVDGEYIVTSEEKSANNTKVAYSASGNRWVDGQPSQSHFHHRSSISTVGEDGTNKNMPPYIAVNIWKRTA